MNIGPFKMMKGNNKFCFNILSEEVLKWGPYVLLIILRNKKK